MGIRIHKILGYYLQANYSKKKKVIVDKRINLENLNKFQEEIYEDDEYLEKFLDWNKKNKDLCITIINQYYNGGLYGQYSWDISSQVKHKKENIKIYESFTLNSEYGKAGLLFFKPLDSKDWCRYDDIIDYYQANSNPINKIKKIVGGIYPYCGKMFLKSNAPKYTGNVPQLIEKSIDVSFYNQMIGKWDKKIEPLINNKEDIKYLKKYYKPSIEYSVLLLIYYAKLFNNYENTINELKCGIYTYWS